MISDNDLYRLAIFLGTCAMMMIVLYHFLDVNARDDETESTDGVKPSKNVAGSSPAPTEHAAAAGKGR
ncbi:hypothetical protein NUU61_004614 [Penicillium alfredii]|uniref:Dolichyl-diphosphooligosaccharide--protein glycosyltransferase subunit 4 n=1 Tax=Penicillium alfredii TaxID=1506179 RepID=A0A9W9KES7_9EURO|nr:uncharacterized protein NUU61_004614 [Penicillium alfredii]KAJ5102392.1 hypothetical protein NUU61_004614 [Penicillium alfredii]